MARFILEEDILLTNRKIFGDKEEHAFNCKCYDGYAECTSTDEDEKIQKVIMKYPLRKEVLADSEMWNAVLDYRGLYDCTKRNITYGDIMLKYGIIEVVDEFPKKQKR